MKIQRFRRLIVWCLILVGLNVFHGIQFRHLIFSLSCNNNESTGRLPGSAIAVSLGGAAKNESAEMPLISVCLPVYEGSIFMEQVLRTLYEQTYRNMMEVLVSIEPSADANTSKEIIETFKANYPDIEIKVFMQPHRLLFAGNLNFLFSKVSGQYFSYMQCDDTLPNNYYELLARCLQKNPDAINCYPRVVAMVDKIIGIGPSGDIHRQPTLDGSVQERVEQLTLNSAWVPFRGLVRKPQFIQKFFLPRLQLHPDIVALVPQAIAGTLIEVDVPYYKYFHKKSLHLTMYWNASVISNENFKRGLVAEYTRKYNLAHSYAASSQKLMSLMSSLLERNLQSQMRQFRELETAVLQEYAKDAVNDFQRRIQQPKRIAVLGAGLQGCLAALLFRKHGYDVTLIDKSSDIMTRASTVGEGRIHLGLEYANDPSFQTAKYMMESAMHFASTVESLVQRKIDWSSLKSERLVSLIPYDSLVTPAQFEEYGNKLEQMYEEILLSKPDLSYLGERPPKILIGRVSVPPTVNATFIRAAYESIEMCILSSKLKLIIKEALDEQGVNMVFGRNIIDVQKSKNLLGNFKVITNSSENDYDAVVNCLWEDRARIDLKMGVQVPSDESYRFKASVRLPNLPIHAKIPSVSIMNGPFGDFVRYGPDDQVYFAWHPSAIEFITQNQTEMQQYEAHANFDFPFDYWKAKVEGHRRAFEMLFPEQDSSFFHNASLGAGFVVANGLTDIDDPESGLHMRCDPPFQIMDGYISIKTQKLTSAPYNILLLEEALFRDTLLGQKLYK